MRAGDGPTLIVSARARAAYRLARSSIVMETQAIFVDVIDELNCLSRIDYLDAMHHYPVLGDAGMWFWVQGGEGNGCTSQIGDVGSMPVRESTCSPGSYEDSITVLLQPCAPRVSRCGAPTDLH